MQPPNKLHVIAVISNPIRFKSRYELFWRFAKRVTDAGAHFHVVEAAFGDRPWHVTMPGQCGKQIQLRTLDELWHKENMINLGINQLPQDWEYVAWVDADVHFARPDWASETVDQLQHYEWVQMWSMAQDLSPTFTPFQSHRSFAWCMLNGQKYDKQKFGSSGWWHPGYAWAATRKAINATGGLLDIGILGAGDNHMAHALYGIAGESIPKGVHPNYRAAVMEWQERARYLDIDIGYVDGLIMHDFHGKKRDRHYYDRWKILVEHQFDPIADLTRDWQGLLQLRPERIALRDAVRKYFRSRHEDSIDVD